MLKVKQIKNILKNYYTIFRLERSAEILATSTADEITRSLALRDFKKYGQKTNRGCAKRRQIAFKGVIEVVEKTLEEVDDLCKACVTNLLFKGKTPVYVEMHYYISESTQRRLLDHFIGEIFMGIIWDKKATNHFKETCKYLKL